MPYRYSRTCVSSLDPETRDPTVRLIKASNKGHDVISFIPQVERSAPDGLLLVYTHDWQPVVTINRFLFEDRYWARRNGKWQNTYRAAAHDLALLITYTNSRNIPLDEVTDDIIIEFGDAMSASVSPSTGMQYCTSTVSRRVSTARTYLAWIKRNGLLKNQQSSDDMDAYSLNNKALPRWPPRMQRKRTAPRGRDPDDIIRPIPAEKLAIAFEQLGPRIFYSDGNVRPHEKHAPSRRDRLTAETALATGMRVDEVSSIRAVEVLQRLQSLDAGNPRSNQPLTVRTKGRLKRTVITPPHIIRGLASYHDHERENATEKALKLATDKGIGYRNPLELFVNEVYASNRDVGRPVTSDTLSRRFSKAMRAAGLTRQQTRYILDPETGDVVYDHDGIAHTATSMVAAHTFHDLRHTFAILFYKAEIERGNREPWEKLRVLLGHATSETTRNVYLRHVSVEETDISDVILKHLER